MTRAYGNIMLAGIVVLAIGLSACGRRGPLEAPPSFAPAPPAAEQPFG